MKFLRRNFFFITLYHVGNLILCLGSQLGHQSIGAGCFLKVPGRIWLANQTGSSQNCGKFEKIRENEHASKLGHWNKLEVDSEKLHLIAIIQFDKWGPTVDSCNVKSLVILAFGVAMILSAWLYRERGFVYCFFQECIDARYWKQKVGIELNKREFFFNNRSSSSFEIAAVEFFFGSAHTSDYQF